MCGIIYWRREDKREEQSEVMVNGDDVGVVGVIVLLRGDGVSVLFGFQWGYYGGVGPYCFIEQMVG